MWIEAEEKVVFPIMGIIGSVCSDGSEEGDSDMG